MKSAGFRLSECYRPGTSAVIYPEWRDTGSIISDGGSRGTLLPLEDPLSLPNTSVYNMLLCFIIQLHLPR